MGLLLPLNSPAPVPAPGGSFRTDPDVLLERHSEIGRLATVVASACRGAGAVALIEGAAGTGRSTVLEAVRGCSAAAGCTVLRARGAASEQGFVFGVVRQLRATAPVYGSALPPTALIAAGADDHWWTVLDGLYRWLVELADREPLLLIVDDCQWADPASMRFLGFLARRIEALPVAVVLSVRDPVPAAVGDWLAELRSACDPLILQLAPLSAKGVSALVRRRLGAGIAAELGVACHAATRGNPALLAELVRELAARSPGSAAEPAGVLGPAPRRISADVGLRLGRLPAPADALARAVALLGAAELPLAAATAGVEGAAAAVAVDVLVEEGLLERVGAELRFVHPLVGRALYEHTPARHRVAAHARAARLLADAGANARAVAQHLMRSDPDGRGWAVDQLRRASAEAAVCGAWAEAARYLRRALAAPSAPSTRAELLHLAGIAAGHAGADDAERLFDQAWELSGDPEQRGRIAYDASGLLSSGGRFLAAAETLARGRAQLGAGRPAIAVELDAALLEIGVLTPAARRCTASHFTRSAAAADALPVEQVRFLLPALAMDLAQRGGTADQVAELADRAAPPSGTDGGRAAPAGLVAWSLTYADRLDAAEMIVSAACEQAGPGVERARGYAMRSLVRWRRGALDDAQADARAALLPGVEAIGAPHDSIAAAVLVSVLVEQDELVSARAAFTQHARRPRDPDDLYDQYLREASARLLLAEGRPGAAMIELNVCERRERAYGGTATIAPVAWRSLAALAHLALGEPHDALRLVDDEVALVRHVGAPGSLGAALRVLGRAQLAVCDPAALATLDEAVTVLRGSSALLERARALRDLGAALRCADRCTQARDRLREGLVLARSCGARALAGMIDHELVAVTRAGRDPRLTPGERRVAGHAAQGLTNRDVARVLYLSVKTVEMHLSNAYRKLAITSRAQLPAALAGR